MKFSVRSALIGVNLIVLLLPIAGVQLMRLYESALVRQTESSLIAQGAFIAAFYRSLIRTHGTKDFARMSAPFPEGVGPAREGDWYPRPPTLDLSESELMPPFPEAREAKPGDQNPESEKLGELLNPTLKDGQLTTLAGIRVVDVNGVIIASTGEDLGLSIRHGEEVAMALGGRSVSRIRVREDTVQDRPLDTLSRTSRLRVFVGLPITMHERIVGAVMLSRTPPSIVQALYAKRHLLFAALGLLLVLVVVMSVFTYRLITRPVSRLVKYAERISMGRSGAQQRVAAMRSPRLTEIARLQRAILDMSEGLEERAAYLQEFARHVSHEFKTPLTGIRGAIEVLKDHREDMDAEQFERFVENITGDVDRLTYLTERLNELTHAEMKQVTLGEVHVLQAVQRVAGRFGQVRLVTDGLNVARISADESILCAALETLFDNAVQHGAHSVTVGWRPSAQGDVLSVANDGEPISPGNQQRLFEPFFTTRRDSGGSGLGLTIATALLQRINATLSLDAKAAQPTFLISFAD